MLGDVGQGVERLAGGRVRRFEDLPVDVDAHQVRGDIDRHIHYLSALRRLQFFRAGVNRCLARQQSGPEKRPVRLTARGRVVYPDNTKMRRNFVKEMRMPETALGTWLKGLRDRRGLSLRDLAERSDVDHAYIYRLETGAKEAPSDEVVDKLLSALTPPKRDDEILRFLATTVTSTSGCSNSFAKIRRSRSRNSIC